MEAVQERSRLDHNFSPEDFVCSHTLTPTCDVKFPPLGSSTLLCSEFWGINWSPYVMISWYHSKTEIVILERTKMNSIDISEEMYESNYPRKKSNWNEMTLRFSKGPSHIAATRIEIHRVSTPADSHWWGNRALIPCPVWASENAWPTRTRSSGFSGPDKSTASTFACCADARRAIISIGSTGIPPPIASWNSAIPSSWCWCRRPGLNIHPTHGTGVRFLEPSLSSNREIMSQDTKGANNQTDLETRLMHPMRAIPWFQYIILHLVLQIWSEWPWWEIKRRTFSRQIGHLVSVPSLAHSLYLPFFSFLRTASGVDLCFTSPSASCSARRLSYEASNSSSS